MLIIVGLLPSMSSDVFLFLSNEGTKVTFASIPGLSLIVIWCLTDRTKQTGQASITMCFETEFYLRLGID